MRTVNLSLVFTENQHLDEHSPVMKVSFQRTNRGDFYTHNFKGVSAYVVFQDISFGNRPFEDYPQRNNYPPNLIDSCINLFVNTLYTPKVIAHNLPKWNIFVELLFLGRNSF